MDANQWIMGTALVLASAAIGADHVTSLPEAQPAPTAERSAGAAPCGAGAAPCGVGAAPCGAGAAPCGAGAVASTTRGDGGELVGARPRDAARDTSDEADDEPPMGARPADADRNRDRGNDDPDELIGVRPATSDSDS